MSNMKAIEAYATADAYRLLGVFLQLPTADVVQGLLDGSVRDDLAAILEEMGCSADVGQSVVDELTCVDDAETGSLSSLRRDFTRLFTNPESSLVPVYESVFKQTGDFDASGLVFVSPTAVDAERAYREFGMAVDAAKHDSPDHMCAEVDFMCALYLRMGELLEAEDGKGAASVRAKADAFCAGHLLKWGERFFSLVSEHARTPAYRMVGALGALLVSREQARVA